MRQSVWAAVEPRQYERKIGPWQLIHGFTIAFLYRVSGLAPLCEMAGRTLGSRNPSSVSQAVPRRSSCGFVWKLVEHLEEWHAPRRGALVALDGMMLSLAKTLRHGCRKVNNRTVGVGVVWAYALDAAAGRCPVRVLQTREGAWHDTQVMRAVSLIAGGPLYLMDRGFYAFDLLERWMDEKVRFIVRAKTKDLRYTVLRPLRCPAAVGAVRARAGLKVQRSASGLRAGVARRAERRDCPESREGRPCQHRPQVAGSLVRCLKAVLTTPPSAETSKVTQSNRRVLP
ncbi:MAG: hypothetical protein NTW86_25255 [Candidatus Sumerlaeota bacterium]|nr:hypothetical protein [Candidatus Sumerlaeota bacterium]